MKRIKHNTWAALQALFCWLPTIILYVLLIVIAAHSLLSVIVWAPVQAIWLYLTRNINPRWYNDSKGK